MSDHHEVHASITSRTLFGFWVYIMTDCVLFATLFATYVVLHNNTYGGPSASQLFHLPFALTETLILLTSSFTCGLVMLAAHRQDIKKILTWCAITFLLGALFLGMEIHEFIKLAQEGNGWHRSGFLSAYFTLVGTHGMHITAGLLWIAVVMAQVWQRGVTFYTYKRLATLSLFWHFLDIVWIFIFTVVYLMGALK